MVAEESPDLRPWLDHDAGRRQPLGSASDGPVDGDAYPFLPIEGESLHQIPVGPVHAASSNPAISLHRQRETVVRLEARSATSTRASTDDDRASIEMLRGCRAGLRR